MPTKKINSLSILKGRLAAVAENRRFTIKGDIGASFMMQVVSSDAPSKFYNFTTKTFTTTFTAENNLRKTLTSNSYYGDIFFPAAAGINYDILLFADPVNPDTKVVNPKTKRDGAFLSEKIEGVANSVVTFSLATGNGSSYKTFPDDITSTGNAALSAGDVVAIDWDIENTDSDAQGFGLKLIGTATSRNTTFTNSESAWYFTTTEAIVSNPAGDGEDGTTVTVADLTDIVVNTELYYHKGTTVPTNKAGSAVGTTTVTAIDTDASTITFSQNVAFEDGETMTFRAYGAKTISNALGMTISFGSSLSITTIGTVLTKVVRADGSLTEATDSSSQNIALVGTYGIAGGNTVGYTGVGVDNRSANKVTTVATASSTVGHITVQLAQVLKAGSVLTFDGSFQDVNIINSVTITQYPTVNRTINLDVDKLITPGAAS